MGSVFGQMKFNLGPGKFRLRELDKAAGERTLLCLLHSMKEIYSKIIAKGGELDGPLWRLRYIGNTSGVIGSMEDWPEKVTYGKEKVRLVADLAVIKVRK